MLLESGMEQVFHLIANERSVVKNLICFAIGLFDYPMAVYQENGTRKVIEYAFKPFSLVEKLAEPVEFQDSLDAELLNTVV